MPNNRRHSIIRGEGDELVRLPREDFAPTVALALRLAGLSDEVEILATKLLDDLRRPAGMEATLRTVFRTNGPYPFVVGPIDCRVLALPTGEDRYVLCSLGAQLTDCPFPKRDSATLIIENSDAHVSRAVITPDMLRRLTWPRVKLVALYHQEVFPLPRMALGIADIAGALRRQMVGRVGLQDMQLGPTVDDVLTELDRERPEIVGISVTFGQNDILNEILSYFSRNRKFAPTIVCGGSLAGLNAQHLLQRMPKLIIGMGSGEVTMKDIVTYSHGELQMNQIRDIQFINENGEVCRTVRQSNRENDFPLPELDLLDETLSKNGVMQLESSRGCSYACSFCPREHKGIWTGDAPQTFAHLLPEIGRAYDAHTHLARKVFLVDEEFIGYRPENEALPRAEGVCRVLRQHGFRFETSSRVDQVYRKTRDQSWHANRMRFWKRLVRDGLDRCLFGVESGVDSILKRFNKKTTGQQNILALRLLSACGVPIRCTYITFDHLMSMTELLESYRFQGRRDILLKPITGMREEELFESVHDETFVRKHARDEPLHREITYMLVSMECLIGSPYLAEVERRGLAREYNYSMGRRNAIFASPIIGLFSHYSQAWIDRTFSLDYTLKSLEKITVEPMRSVVHRIRQELRHAAYELLGQMLVLSNGDTRLLAADASAVTRDRVNAMIPRWHNGDQYLGQNEQLLIELLDGHITDLQRAIDVRFSEVRDNLNSRERAIVEHELGRWMERQDWHLINAA